MLEEFIIDVRKEQERGKREIEKVQRKQSKREIRKETLRRRIRRGMSGEEAIVPLQRMNGWGQQTENGGTL